VHRGGFTANGAFARGSRCLRAEGSTPGVTAAGLAPSAPVIAAAEPLVNHLLELLVLLYVNFAEAAILAKQDRLQAHQLEQRKEHGHDRTGRARVREQLREAHRPVFHHEATA